jgi:MFS family permease
MSRTFKSLRHRNFALYCAGIAASLTGSWMQSVAIAWVAYSLTGSSAVLGMVAFATLVPTIVFSLPGGWIAARYDRKRILLVTQSLALLQSAVLVFLTATGQIHVWELLALSSVLGGLIAFELAARFPLIAELVDKDELMNACSLDSFLFYSARALGPAVGGVLLGVFGATVCFSINAGSYIVELITLLAIAKAPSVRKESGGDLKATLAFFWRPGNRAVMVLMSLTSLFAVYLALMPVFAKGILPGNATTLGELVAASEVGALLASLWLARRPNDSGLIPTLGWSSLAMSALLVGFCLSSSLYLSLALLVGVGFCLTIVLMGAHGMMQCTVSDELRGMMASLFWMINLGLQSVGALILGWLAETYGAPWMLIVGAIICLIGGWMYLLKTKQSR